MSNQRNRPSQPQLKRVGNYVQDSNCPGAYKLIGGSFSVTEHHGLAIEKQAMELSDLKKSMEYLIELVMYQSDQIHHLTTTTEKDDMHARFLEYTQKYNISMGQVLEYWDTAKKDAKAKRLKDDSPKFFDFAMNRIEQILEEKHGQNAPEPEEPQELHKLESVTPEQLIEIKIPEKSDDSEGFDALYESKDDNEHE